jgi:enoyl-CoA hydratase
MPPVQPNEPPVLTVERRDAIAIVTLNRPDKLNALNLELTRAIGAAFRELQADDGIAAAILTGAGRAFCAGLDLKALEQEGGMSGRGGEADAEFYAAISGFDRPLIGAINGVAITGGFELALACDLLIASPAAKFADTHARVGVIPGWGLSQLLSRIIGVNRARELSFTGNYLTADKAEAWGLVNRVVPAEELLSTCVQLATDMASCDRATLRRYKRLNNDGAALALKDALALEQEVHMATRGEVTGDAIARRRQQVQARGRDQVEK